MADYWLLKLKLIQPKPNGFLDGLAPKRLRPLQLSEPVSNSNWYGDGCGNGLLMTMLFVNSDEEGLHSDGVRSWHGIHFLPCSSDKMWRHITNLWNHHRKAMKYLVWTQGTCNKMFFFWKVRSIRVQKVTKVAVKVIAHKGRRYVFHNHCGLIAKNGWTLASNLQRVWIDWCGRHLSVIVIHVHGQYVWSKWGSNWPSRISSCNCILVFLHAFSWK